MYAAIGAAYQPSPLVFFRFAQVGDALSVGLGGRLVLPGGRRLHLLRLLDVGPQLLRTNPDETLQRLVEGACRGVASRLAAALSCRTGSSTPKGGRHGEK